MRSERGASDIGQWAAEILRPGQYCSALMKLPWQHKQIVLQPGGFKEPHSSLATVSFVFGDARFFVRARNSRLFCANKD